MDQRRWNTLVSLCAARGYGAPVAEEDGDDGLLRAKKKGDVDLLIFVFPQKVGIRETRRVAAQLEGPAKKLAVHSGITTYAAQHLSKNVELFHIDELAFDPLKHRCVPTYRRVSANEVRRHNLTKLPRMLSNDIIARWYGFKPKTVVEIQSDSPEGHCFPEYRIVV